MPCLQIVRGHPYSEVNQGIYLEFGKQRTAVRTIKLTKTLGAWLPTEMFPSDYPGEIHCFLGETARGKSTYQSDYTDFIALNVEKFILKVESRNKIPSDATG
jgi:hypothetical protein